MTVQSTQRTNSKGLWALALAVAILALPVIASAVDISIQVSPNVLNLASKGEVVTVHTDIPYAEVVGASVYIGDQGGDWVAISWWKADDRGDFVAKFVMDEVKSIPDIAANETYTVVLQGRTDGGEMFAGTSDIKVVDRSTKF